jgi:methyl-accepting chemotaxis protein
MGPSALRLVTLLMVVLAAGGLAACGKSQAEKASDRVCNARDDIAEQVKTLQGLTLSTATTSKVSDSLKSIQSDLSTIADAQGDLSEDRRKNVKAANEAFKSTMSQIASSVGRTLSLRNAATQTKQALQQLGDSYRDTLGKIDCS